MSSSALSPEHMLQRARDDVPAEFRNGPARRVVMLKLIPANPPCFEPEQWRQYVLDAAEQDRPRHGPLTFVNGEPLFNRGFSFCEFCTPKHAVAMDRQRRCHPDYYRKPRSA